MVLTVATTDGASRSMPPSTSWSSFPENATTGYVWQVTSLAGPARLVTDRPRPGPATPGAAGTRRLELALHGSGVVTLRAVSRRPGEPDTNARVEYRLEISVRG
jgi:predicted secreted protein